MIVLDNIIFSLQEAGGISVFWQNLISRYIGAGLDLRFIDYAASSSNLSRANLNIAPGLILPSAWLGSVASQFMHPRVKSSKPFIFHSSYYRTSRSEGALNVTTVHDFIVERRARTLKDRLRVALNHQAIRHSQAVVCVSESTRDDLFKFMPDVPHDRVHVITNGVSDAYRRLPDMPFPEFADYLIYVGGRQTYKHFEVALDVAAQSGCGLIICGAQLSAGEQTDVSRTLGGKYKVFEYPPDELLNRLFNSAKALIYPSESEGFGLPVAEAQRAGCPVIAMCDTPQAAVGGDAVLTFGKDGVSQAGTLVRQLSDPSMRRSVIESGVANSMQYSWQSAAHSYMALYRSLLRNFE